MRAKASGYQGRGVVQLKIKRSQKKTLISGSAVFCLDARVMFTPPEAGNVSRYRLEKECIYNSEASKRHLAALDQLLPVDGVLRFAVRHHTDVVDEQNFDVGEPEAGPAVFDRAHDLVLFMPSAGMMPVSE